MQLDDLAGADVVLLGVGVETLTVLPHLRTAGVGRIRVVEPADIGEERRGTLADHGVDDAAILDDVPDGAEVVLRSPGFPRHRSDVDRLCANARLATTPTGLWLAIRGGPGTIAVTGTKGKSSTATLIAEGLGMVGLDHELVGNIGTVAWSVDPTTDAVVVAELSSYHGADLVATGEIVVLTLLAEDHLDWHGGVATYHRDKLRIVEAAQGDGTPPVHRFTLADTPLDEPLASTVEQVHAPAGADHRLRNVALAVTAVRAEAALRGVDVPDGNELGTALAAAYPDLPGRFHTIASRDGITWIDDALGSNPSATAAALEHLAPGPAVLICGGHDRLVAIEYSEPAGAGGVGHGA